jgi:glycine cleavage system H protein
VNNPEIPQDLHYTPQHEWVRTLSEHEVQLGVTAFAQRSLGDIVFVTLPAVGAQLTAGVVCGEVESTKSVSDIFAPLTGEVIATNEDLHDHPELINSDPYGQGWLLKLRVTAANQQLLSPENYLGHTE